MRIKTSILLHYHGCFFCVKLVFSGLEIAEKALKKPPGNFFPGG